MELRYFTYELISAANDWIEQSGEDFKQAEKKFRETAEAYKKSLDELKPRLSKPAWEFFRFGFAQTGLHDANLLALRAGDAVYFELDGKQPLRLNKKKASVEIEFLNYEQNLHYLFDAGGVARVKCDLFVEYGKAFGDLYAYEIAALDEEYLQLGFLFASGATIIVKFRKLIFRKRKIKREYPVGNIYS